MFTSRGLIEDEGDLVGLDDIGEESNRLLSKNKRLADLLHTLQKSVDYKDFGDNVHFEGFLWRKSPTHSTWKRVYFSILDDTLSWFDKKESKRPSGSINVTFCTATSPIHKDEARLITSNTQQQKFKLFIFSKHKMLTVSADSEEELIKLHEFLMKTFKNFMSERDFSEKKRAAEEVISLLEAKEDSERERLIAIISALESSGIVSSKSKVPKLKSGRLEMEKGDNNFVPYFVSLYPDALYLFKKSNEGPKGSIPITKDSIISVVDETAFLFSISLKRNTWVFRAKHQVALSEWIEMLNSITKKKSGKSNEFADLSTLTIAVPDGNIRTLLYKTDQGPVKVYRFPEAACSVVIGRSSTCSLLIDEDKKLSREHAKIESKDGVTFTFSDLGSSRGSKVNGEPVTSCVLKHGDKIKLGSTKMNFKVGTQ